MYEQPSCIDCKLALLGKVTIKVISLAGITSDFETDMLILTMYLKKYLKMLNTLGKYLNTNIFSCYKRQLQIPKKVFKY